MAWITRDDVDGTREVTIVIPGGTGHLADLLGAYLYLCQMENWQQTSGVSPEDAADAWLEAYSLTEELNP